MAGSIAAFLSCIACLLYGSAILQAEPIPMKSVEAAIHAGDATSLAHVIDDIEGGPQGWSVSPKFTESQALVVRSVKPVMAAELDITLFFLSGRENHSIAEFDLAYTTDAEPSLSGNWIPLLIQRYAAEVVNLSRLKNGHLRARGSISYAKEGTVPDDIYRLVAQLPGARATGFRLRAFPLVDKKGVPYAMSWSAGRDFLLTEFRVEEHVRATTNIALLCPVKSSHPLFGTLLASALTDGQPSTIAHPVEKPDAQFHFDIDLGRPVTLDHINLFGRGDKYPERFSQVRIQLYEQDPNLGAAPVWTGMDRADGSHPGLGEHDAIRADLGRGDFRGRYLRLSTESKIPLSPQFAEVEAYELRTLETVAAYADGKELPIAGGLDIPPGVKRLSLRFRIPQVGLPRGDLFRWRIQGDQEEWQVSRTMTLDIPCPPPGRTVFEAQALHSDREWDATVFKFPIIVRQYFWETRSFQMIISLVVILSTAALSRFLTKRRAARQLARELADARRQGELESNRLRIARDMHDDIGARLTHIAYLADQAEQTVPVMRDIAHEARETVDALDHIVWAVNPQGDTVNGFAEYISIHAARYLAVSGIRLRQNIVITTHDGAVGFEARHGLLMACKEALQNILKHSGAREVMLEITDADHVLSIVLTDDGCGLGPAVAGVDHSGLDNMRERLAECGGTCLIESPAAGGVRVTFRLPLIPT